MSHSRFSLKNFGSLNVNGSEISNKTVQIMSTAAATLTADDSGKTFYLNSVTEFATTLPLASSAPGFQATFIIKSAPVGADYTILSASNNIHGVITTSQDAGGSSNSTNDTPIDVITFVDGIAKTGDFVNVSCDGTNYYVNGSCGLYNAITLT